LLELVLRGNIVAIRRHLAELTGPPSPRISLLRDAAARLDLKRLRALLENPE